AAKRSNVKQVRHVWLPAKRMRDGSGKIQGIGRFARPMQRRRSRLNALARRAGGTRYRLKERVRSAMVRADRGMVDRSDVAATAATSHWSFFVRRGHEPSRQQDVDTCDLRDRVLRRLARSLRQ